MLSNTAVPRYYGAFRDAVMAGQIPICETIEMQMHRIDEKIANPDFYYDDQAVEGFVAYCNNELTLTDGSDLELLDSFKLWAEDIFGWYRFVEQAVPIPSEDGTRMRYVRKRIKKRLCNKQYLIVARGAAKTMYGSSLHSYFLNIDTTTHGPKKQLAKAANDATIDGEFYRSEKGFSIHQDKLKNFCLKPGGKHSEQFFRLGYTADDPERLFRDIEEGYDLSKRIVDGVIASGKVKFSIPMRLGVTSTRLFRTVWQEDDSENASRFITAYIDRRLKEDD